MGFACLAWLHNHVHPHQTGDLVRVRTASETETLLQSPAKNEISTHLPLSLSKQNR